MGLFSIRQLVLGWQGRRLPVAPAVDLRFPLATGRYLVVSGGTNLSLNPHADALDTTVAGHRPWLGTGYALDLVALDRLVPVNPAAYFIFNTPVLAPCAGTVLVARDGRPDMPIPHHDDAHPSGNYLILRGAQADIVLAHFQRGSLRVRAGAQVVAGQVLARAGNSGATDEPHLHIHAQRPGPPGYPMGGAPLPMRFGKRFLVRNDRIIIPVPGFVAPGFALTTPTPRYRARFPSILYPASMSLSASQTRRNFLRLGGIAAAACALSPLLVGCEPVDYEAAANRARQPAKPEDHDLHTLVRLATLAPSGHNTQPWKFRILPATIQIYPDLTRRVPVVDPDDRELWISLGSALENLLVAAEYFGYQAETTYHLAGTPDDHISIALEKPGAKRSRPPALFEAIPRRQCTRNEYDQKSVPITILRSLEAAATGAGVSPLMFTGAAAMEPLLEYVNAGNEQQLTDDKFRSELINWLRFTDREAVEALDGLASGATGNPKVPRWLAQLFIGNALNPEAQNKKDNLHIRSSSGLLLFASQKNDTAAWIETGRAYERFALLATARNIKNAFINQPCEVPELRAQVQAQLKLNGAFPQLLVRFGHGLAMPRSLRRPVGQVLLAAAS